MYIFLYGADTFQSQEKLRALKNKYLEKNSSGLGLSVLDYAGGASAEDLSDLLVSQGLFSSKQFIAAQNILTSLSPDKQKEIQKILEQNKNLETDADTVIVFYESASPKKNLSFFKYLSQHAKKQEFTTLEEPKLSQWVVSYAQSLNKETSFEPAALRSLVIATGNDLYLLSNEIQKLVNYKNTGTINKEDVNLLVKSRIDSTIFQAIEALASGNKSRALSLLHEQISKGEDIFYILSMYIYQVRTLLKISDSMAQGMTAPALIAKETGLHPYVVQKSLAQVRNLSLEKIKKMMQSLAQIDQDSKTGRVDPVLALDSFIVSL